MSEGEGGREEREGEGKEKEPRREREGSETILAVSKRTLNTANPPRPHMQPYDSTPSLMCNRTIAPPSYATVR